MDFAPLLKWMSKLFCMCTGREEKTAVAEFCAFPASKLERQGPNDAEPGGRDGVYGFMFSG